MPVSRRHLSTSVRAHRLVDAGAPDDDVDFLPATDPEVDDVVEVTPKNKNTLVQPDAKAGARSWTFAPSLLVDVPQFGAAYSERLMRSFKCSAEVSKLRTPACRL
jgi:hypothetical protein